FVSDCIPRTRSHPTPPVSHPIMTLAQFVVSGTTGQPHFGSVMEAAKERGGEARNWECGDILIIWDLGHRVLGVYIIEWESRSSQGHSPLRATGTTPNNKRNSR